MKILLIAGHGNGDPGAVANGYKEEELTRETVALLKPLLFPYAEVTVFDTSKNAYKFLSNGGKFDFSQFDYVLELHLNAGSTDKDSKVTGSEIYITTSEKVYSVEIAILANLEKLGFKNRGVKRKNFTVINTAKKAGVSSALLELCFIDDKDDMKLYQSRKNEVVEAIANGIVSGYKLTKKAAWYDEFLEKAKEYGVTDGTRPDDSATRAEVATMIVRAIEYIKKTEV